MELSRQIVFYPFEALLVLILLIVKMDTHLSRPFNFVLVFLICLYPPALVNSLIVSVPNSTSALILDHVTATFGAGVGSYNVKAPLIVSKSLACDAPSSNDSEYDGKVILIRRGGCRFLQVSDRADSRHIAYELTQNR